MTDYRVIVCREGFCKPIAKGAFSAACTITLICGKFNILFDPGSPWDADMIHSILGEHNLECKDIDYVICSHGHVDHIGSLNCFPSATILIGTEIMRSGRTVEHNFSFVNPFIIDDNVRIIFTPGHTKNDVSLVVEKTREFGTVVVSGDLFESQQDLLDSQLWKSSSLDAILQERSRNYILSFANYIIPGHGSMFRV
ncbi:unnamed protein product [Mesocestoides corti]|uniref:Metallo-beta-lactamase domain-containing protein 1 n=1 Tax=Mesocestoides corti TaxID=53468 RepID=A0A0R3UKM6_MESCO|nr:unnamed protein product [Mesocestoides corti]